MVNMTNKKYEWWKKAVFYQIYMPSFCDGNGDGIGDFIGITSKLDYIKQLGIDCIWLTPFYKSPKIDNGYDISDYYNIDEDYGNMNDFDIFIKKAHELNIKVIADIVINHTSDKHEWFIESKSSKNNPKRDWYIWKESINNNIPNNWESFFGENAWQYDDTTKEYYYHAFSKEQIDLNWNNADMRKAIFEMLTFWIDKGVDGFRLDVINFLIVNEDFTDNPYDETGKQIHLYDINQKGIFNIIKDIRNFADSYSDKFLVGEIGDSEDIERIHDYVGNDKLHTTFNFNIGSKKTLNVKDFYNEMVKMNKIYKQDFPTLFFGSHDMSRFPSRFNLNDNEIKLIATLMLTFRGIPFIYFGDEIGMRDIVYKNVDMAKDIQGIIAYNKCINEGKSEIEALEKLNKSGRDKSRNVMQWNNECYGGFSQTKPWIATNKEYKNCNVEYQKIENNSIFNYYKNLIELRKENNALCIGECTEINIKDNIIWYIRQYGNNKIVVVLNFSDKSVNLSDLYISIDSVLKTSNLNCNDEHNRLSAKCAGIYKIS